MTISESIILAIVTSFVGYTFDAWSERQNDVLVRRFSTIYWLVIAVVATAASFYVDRWWDSLAAALATSNILIIAGRSIGLRVGDWLKDTRTRRSQRRARQEVR
jgi:ABC-type transport system involved in multi-copper enzyme maturation permease subunit